MCLKIWQKPSALLAQTPGKGQVAEAWVRATKAISPTKMEIIKYYHLFRIPYGSTSFRRSQLKI